jgi:hypothetical protein
MPNTQRFHLEALQFHPLTLMARVRDLVFGDLLTQADLTAISYTVFDLDGTNSDAAVVSGSLTVSSVVSNILTVDDRWPLDQEGFNFSHTLPDSTLSVPHHTYQVEYQFTPTDSTTAFALIYTIRVLEWHTGETMRIGDPLVNGATGAVLFVDSSLNLGQDPTNLKWDPTNQRLTVNNTILLANAPTTDPNVTGAIWSDQGVLTLSGFTAGQIGVTQYMKKVTVPISATQLSTADTSPITLVAAPSATQTLLYMGALATYTFAVSAYNNIQLFIAYKDTTAAFRVAKDANILNQGANAIGSFTEAGAALGASANILGQALVLYASGATPNAGSAGTLSITLFYAVV